VFGKRGGPPRDTSFGDAHFLGSGELQALGLVGRGGIPLGDYAPPNEAAKRLYYAGDQHIVTIAPSRTGKGTTAIIPTLLDHDASMLVIDPKGQNAAVTARRRAQMHQGNVFVVNPFGLHTGRPWNLPQHKFNPLAAIDTRSENFVADVSSLCEAIIVTEGKDPHWSNAARDLVSAIIMDLKLREPAKATLPEMRRILTLPPNDFKERLIDMAVSDEPAVKNRAGRFLATTNEMQAIISTAITQTSFLDDPALAASLSGNDFRLIDLKRKGMTVFLVLPSRYLAAYFRWLRLFVVSALDSLTSTTDRPAKPVLFVLDEFASLGHLTAIETAMALAAGYGVQLWPILQDTSQVKTIYSDRWETFLANAGITQIFRPNDLTTAEYFSKRAGTYTHQLTGMSYRTDETDYSRAGDAGPADALSRNFSLIARPLITAHGLFGLPDDRQILFVSGSEFPALSARQPYYRDKRYQPHADPDPYHTPTTAKRPWDIS
jgi:type IV secretion system protein VirD4